MLRQSVIDDYFKSIRGVKLNYLENGFSASPCLCGQ